MSFSKGLSRSIKIAQKPHIIGSLGPKVLKYESFEGEGMSKVQGLCNLGGGEGGAGAWSAAPAGE